MSDWDSFSTPVTQDASSSGGGWDSFSTPVKQPSTMDNIKSAVSGIGEAVSNPKATVDAIGAKSELGQIPNWETAKELGYGAAMGAANLYDAVRGNKYVDQYNQALGGEPYAESGEHKAIEALNVIHNKHVQETPYGGTANFVGQIATTPIVESKMVGATEEGASFLGATGKSLARGTEQTAGAALTGGEFAVKQPREQADTPQDLDAQVNAQFGSGMVAGGAPTAGLGLLGKTKSLLADWWRPATNAGVKSEIGGKIKSELENQSGGMEALNNAANVEKNQATKVSVENGQTTVTKPGAVQDTTSATQNPNLQSFENSASTGVSKNALAQQRQEVNQNLAGQVESQLQNAKTAEGKKAVQAAPEQDVAASNLYNSQKLEVTQSHNEVNKAYAIDKKEQLPAKADDQLKEEFTNTNKGNEKLIENDPLLSKIYNKYQGVAEVTTRDTGLLDAQGNKITTISTPPDTNIPVGQQARDIVDLRQQARENFADAKETAGTDGKVLFTKGTLAANLANSIENNVLRLPETVKTQEGVPVAQAMQEAKAKYLQHQATYVENPNTGQIQLDENGQPTGVKYKKSMGETGQMMYRTSSQTEPNTVEGGNRLIDSSKVGKFKESLDNFTEKQGPVVGNKIKADIKAAGGDKAAYDKYWSTSVQDAMATKYPDQYADITNGHGQAILDDIKSKSMQTIDNPYGAGQINTIDYAKYTKAREDNKEFLSKIFTPEELSAHQKVIEELAKNNFSIRGQGSTESIAENSVDSKIVRTAVKSALSKIGGVPIGGAESSLGIIDRIRASKVEKVMNNVISSPLYAKQLVDAVDAAPKDPTAIGRFFDRAAELVPAGAGIEAGQNYNHPLKVNITPEDKKEEPKVNLPQSKNEVPNANQESFLSRFSPVSNANASELPAGVESSKKNNEFQIADASKQTGMPKEYFTALEKAETGNIKNPDTARNSKSSAYGRGQFTEKTWNGLADEYDLPPITDQNRYTKDDPRSNPKYSRLAAGYYGSDNADNLRPWIQSKFGRDATIGDVYGAHLMGLGGIKQFLSANPDSPAADVVPAAAKNNRSLFYANGGKGTALSVRQVYRNIEDRLMPESVDITHEQDTGPQDIPDYGKGNIDLNNRPVIKNKDGSISTVRSISFSEDGKEILIPTTSKDGSRLLSDDEAIQQYHKTGQYLGKFDNEEDATKYAKVLHNSQSKQYLGK